MNSPASGQPAKYYQGSRIRSNIFALPDYDCMKPRLAGQPAALKTDRFGNTVARSASLTPNQDASVAPYWSRAVVGIHTPRLPASSVVEKTKVGNLPYMSPPFTAPPRMK